VTLIVTCNIARPDDLYDRLVSAQEGLNAEQRAILYNKLILFLANHIGDEDIIFEAIRLAAAATAPCRDDLVGDR